VLTELEGEGRIVPVAIAAGRRAWPGRWYVHADDLPALERLAAGEWLCWLLRASVQRNR